MPDEPTEYDADTLHDYVIAHGSGTPTPAAYTLAAALWSQGDDYATIAHEIVFRGLTNDDRDDD